MTPTEGDTPSGPGGLPLPPRQFGYGLYGLGNAWAQLMKLFASDGYAAYLSGRLARDTDARAGTGKLPKYG